MKSLALSLVIIINFACSSSVNQNVNLNVVDPEYFCELSMIINAEADTKDIRDMELVGSSVLNRAGNKDFPSSIDSVIMQYRQYDGYLSNQYYRTPISDSIAFNLLLGIGRDYDVLYFYNFHTTKNHRFLWWIRNNTEIIYQSKYHKFFKLK